ncbi:phosphohydrolase, partial [bacterium]|nr:phosphohydrolase [bacterium]
VETVSELGTKKTWEQRKQNTIDLLKSASKDVILIECADKLDNIRAIVEDYERLGEHVWKKFSRPRDSQAWYYLSMVESLRTRKFTTNAAALIKEFSQEVSRIF